MPLDLGTHSFPDEAPSMSQHAEKYCKLFMVILFGAGMRKEVCRALQGNLCTLCSPFPVGFLNGRRGV